VPMVEQLRRAVACYVRGFMGCAHVLHVVACAELVRRRINMTPAAAREFARYLLARLDRLHTHWNEPARRAQAPPANGSVARAIDAVSAKPDDEGHLVMEHVQKPVGASADLPPSPWTHVYYGEPGYSVYQHIDYTPADPSAQPAGKNNSAILARALWDAGYYGSPLWNPPEAGQPLPENKIHDALASGRNGIANLASMTRFDGTCLPFFPVMS